jgi:glycosyltransferase involved in cell wall biosynthesis
MKNILYLISGFNLFGGTPKKTLDLISSSSDNCSLYVWTNGYKENKHLFVDAGATVYEGYYNRNIFKHIFHLLKIIDENKILIIQTQFSFGEILAGLIKVFRPKMKIIIAFVGPFSPTGFKKILLNYLYGRNDAYVFVSEYVKREKIKVFPRLASKKNVVIYNGTNKRINNKELIPKMDSISLLDVAGLVDWKNAEVLIKAMAIIIKERQKKDIYLYLAGDGPIRQKLESLISLNSLEKNVSILGYQSNIGGLLDQCDIFVHPAYAEGFGIVIPEAMMAEKPIIISNSGALPELIENEVSGLIVDPYDERQWATAIIRFIDNKELAKKVSKNAKTKALEEFSVEKFVGNYQLLYNSI